jgi:hypothetical protein
MYGKTLQYIPIWVFMCGFSRFLIILKDSFFYKSSNGYFIFPKLFSLTWVYISVVFCHLFSSGASSFQLRPAKSSLFALFLTGTI